MGFAEDDLLVDDQYVVLARDVGKWLILGVLSGKKYGPNGQMISGTRGFSGGTTLTVAEQLPPGQG